MGQSQTENQSSESRRQLELLQKHLFAESQSDALAEKTENTIDYDAKNIELDYQIRKEKVESRRRWDGCLLKLVIIGFGLSYLLIIIIGLGILKFDNSPFAVPSIVAVGIIQTYGLAKIAAKYFFSDDK